MNEMVVMLARLNESLAEEKSHEKQIRARLIATPRLRQAHR